MKKERFDRNVILTGVTSFFTDVSSEMIYPLLQAFVSSVLSSSQVLLGPVLGIIEGVAESAASLLKVITGYYSDRRGRRKTPTIAGYTVSALSKAMLLLAGVGWYFVLIARFTDRVGKGIRTAPRDALISESVDPSRRGFAFGIQRAMDFAGATLGVVILYFVSLRYLDPVAKTITDFSVFHKIFIISLVPAALGVVTLFFLRETGGRQQGTEPVKERPKPNLSLKSYDRSLKLFFLVQFIFTLGNSSNQFLLLRSMNLGNALSTVVLMYLVYNLTTAAAAALFGSLSDRIGRKWLMVTGYLLYALVYGAFGFLPQRMAGWMWLLWVLYGIYSALTDGCEKAFVADLAPKASKATALGFYHTAVGITLLPASVIAGLLFTVHPGAPFLFGAVVSCIAALLLARVKERHAA